MTKIPVAQTIEHEFESHLRSVSNGDVTWSDLIERLSATELVATDAALLLHAWLGVTKSNRNVNVAPQFWQEHLSRRGVSADARAGALG